ncbi:MAG: hypothetical protein NVS4B9_17710 [Ktedonobacteraceae bacterium]
MPQRDARIIGGLYRTGQIVRSDTMLTSYIAYDSNTNDVVGLYVIEVPAEQLSALPRLLQPLTQRQAIQSMHVIKLHNWGIDGSRIYIATDPPRGVTLQHLQNTENIVISRAVDICKQLALGLTVLHATGVAGLDLRPQFITVDTVSITDRVQIDDIGLRSLLQSLNFVSQQSSDDIGYLDPRYAPPEYIKSATTGPWSDIYQVGLLLFTLITGRLPFVGRTMAETGILQANNPVPHIQQYEHNVPRAFQAFIERCMEKEPAMRFSSATELVAALETLQQVVQSAQSVQSANNRSTEQAEVAPTREMSSLEVDAAQREGPQDGKKLRAPAVTNIPTEAGIYAYLTYEKKVSEKKPPELQRIPLLQKSIIVGRTDPKRGVSPDIDLTLFDPEMTVSRLHARISFEGSFFYIEDLKSRNKTRLGSLVLSPMRPELLQHEDVLSFGRVRMRFQIPGMGNIASIKKEQVSG